MLWKYLQEQHECRYFPVHWRNTQCFSLLLKCTNQTESVLCMIRTICCLCVTLMILSVLITNFHYEYKLPHSTKMDNKYFIRLLSHWKEKLYSRLSIWRNIWKCFYCWRQWLVKRSIFECRYCYTHHKCMCCPVILNDVSKFVYFYSTRFFIIVKCFTKTIFKT